MAELMFNEEDLRQIKDRGIPLEKVIFQIEIFKRGSFYLKLKRPCTIGDGINLLEKNDLARLTNLYSEAALSGRTMKFVPASGAASRMFKLLSYFNNRYPHIDEKLISTRVKENDPEHKRFFQFVKGIKQFAFYDDLKTVMSKDGFDIENLIAKGQFKDILEYLLTERGLNYANLPKGLIKFHRYPDHSRSSLEEHLVEAAAYTQDRDGISRIHFTISPEYEEAIKSYIGKIRSRYETSGIKYEISFSFQKPSTDTIAVDLLNRPFRDRDARLVFRPGGHGALLENLNDLKGDIVFIKNIDNVVPDRLKQKTYLYKKAFGGYLIELQKEIFGYLKRLARREADKQFVKQAFEFLRFKLFITPPDGIEQASKDEKINFLFSKLNRPLRVCGMVKNEGEPGGGPFWVEGKDGSLSLQIVESAQIDPKSEEQQKILASSTHFNPVDIVCGIRDFRGNSFDLRQYMDTNAVFISRKSKDGRELKALELPGLWNGAMAYFNTIFVEVPLITFNPVKTINDLLRREHQPGSGSFASSSSFLA
jgi:hypothetical protein